MKTGDSEMPIQCQKVRGSIPEADFREIDYKVTGLAFEVHGRIGRLPDEDVYKNELAASCLAAGFEYIDTEVPVNVTHLDFKKVYYIDLLIDGRSLYELKAVEKTGPMHEAQALNYLFLIGLQYGKILNFRPPSVERRFVSTTLTPHDRKEFKIEDEVMDADCPAGLRIKSLMRDLLSDWGALLQIELYREALFHFFGGKDDILKARPLVSDSRTIGAQSFPIVAADTTFRITGLKRGLSGYRDQLLKLMGLSGLKCLHWINMNGRSIDMLTLRHP